MLLYGCSTMVPAMATSLARDVSIRELADRYAAARRRLRARLARR
jgi:hypothetical protein